MEKTILLINQNQVLLGLTRRILERAGYLAFAAEDADGARILCETHEPDCVVYDANDFDETAIGFVRDIGKKGETPVMVVTGDPKDEIPALNAGAFDYLRKPYDIDILLERVKVMVNSSANRPAQPMAKRMYATAAVFAFAVLATVAINSSRNGGGIIDFGDEPIALGSPQFVFEEEIHVEYPQVECVSLPAGTDEAQVSLKNPEANECLLVFELALDDGGEKVFTTEQVEPGSEAGAVKLTKALDEGCYSATLYIRAYTPDGMFHIGGEEQSVRVFAE